MLSLHWKDSCWSWNSNTLSTWCEELTHLKRPWCWERLKAGEKGTTEDEMVGWHHQLDGHEFDKLQEMMQDREAWQLWPTGSKGVGQTEWLSSSPPSGNRTLTPLPLPFPVAQESLKVKLRLHRKAWYRDWVQRAGWSVDQLLKAVSPEGANLQGLGGEWRGVPARHRPARCPPARAWAHSPSSIQSSSWGSPLAQPNWQPWATAAPSVGPESQSPGRQKGAESGRRTWRSKWRESGLSRGRGRQATFSRVAFLLPALSRHPPPLVSLRWAMCLCPVPISPWTAPYRSAQWLY